MGLFSLGWLLHPLANQIGPGWPAVSLTLVAVMTFLAVTAYVFAFVNQFAVQSSRAATDLVKDRRDHAESESLESRHWLQLAEKIAHVGHWRYLVATGVLIWSDEMYEIFGVSKLTHTPDVTSTMGFVCPDDRKRVEYSFETVVARKEPFEISVALQRPDEQRRHVTTRGVPELDAAGDLVSVFGVFVDITEQRKIQDEARALASRALEELAMQDSLTGLPNRRQLDATLSTEFRRAAREQAPIGLIMIDLDRFKHFNNIYGRSAGDACLREVAAAIAGVPQRPADFVARHGGGTMVVMLPGTDITGAQAVAALMLESVRDLKIPHAQATAKIVTVSCGLACFWPEQDPHAPEMLLQRANEALHLAKQAGRDRVTCWMEEV